MKYCPNCGAQLSDDAMFCPACGARFGAPQQPYQQQPYQQQPYQQQPQYPQQDAPVKEKKRSILGWVVAILVGVALVAMKMGW